MNVLKPVYVFTLLFLMLALPACFETDAASTGDNENPSDNPCDTDVQCAALFRTCENQEGQAVCGDCLNGYENIDGECVQQSVDLCQDDTCNGHGQCSDDTGAIVCTCNVGYAGERCESCDTENGWYLSEDETSCITDACAEACDAEAHRVCETSSGECICDNGYCDIFGECVADGTTNLNHVCEICDSTAEKNGWSLKPSGELCREAQGECDPAESCDGESKDCPADAYVDNGTDCDDGNACTVGDSCVNGACTAGDPLDCNDDNLCTDDQCDTETGCEYLFNDESCDDGDACTLTDVCHLGECQGKDPNPCTPTEECREPDTCNPETGECSFTVSPNGTACDDGDPQTLNDVCINGECLAVGCTCSEVNDCCNGCVPRADFTACDDGDACTATDVCLSGACQGFDSTDCNDNNPCTDDSCNSTQGCVHTDNTLPCDDGDLCTGASACQNGQCMGGDPVVCQPLSQCHAAGQCNPLTGVCTNPTVADGTTCDDGNTQTSGEQCTNGMCVTQGCECAGVNDCCDGCDIRNENATCDDSDACTENTTCHAGVCAGTPLQCNDNNPCTDDSCNAATGCVHTDNTLPCNDSNLCTRNDTCFEGECHGVDVVCSSDNPCVSGGECNRANGECRFQAAPNGLSCDDGNPDTSNDACLNGMCIGEGCQCSGVNECCDGCHPMADLTPCNDGDACTVIDTCRAGVCNGQPRDCNDNNPCTDDACDEELGCIYGHNNNVCDDNDLCTSGDTCSNGQCHGSPSVTCDPPDECQTEGVCQPETGLCDYPNVSDGTACEGGECRNGMCVPQGCECSGVNDCCDGCHAQAEGNSCDDGNACTMNEQCSNGVCQPQGTVECNDDNPCTNDACRPDTGCTYTDNSNPCDDDDLCTTGDVCFEGECNGVAVSCNETYQCKAPGACNPDTGLCNYEPSPDGTLCDDGNPATFGDACTNGLCLGTPAQCGNGIIEANEGCEFDADCPSNLLCVNCQCESDLNGVAECLDYKGLSQCWQHCTPAPNTCTDPDNFFCSGFAGVNEQNQLTLGGGSCIPATMTDAQFNIWLNNLTECETNEDCGDGESCITFGGSISRCVESCEISADTCPSSTFPGYEQLGEAPWPCEETVVDAEGTRVGLCDSWATTTPPCDVLGEECDPTGADLPVCGDGLVEGSEQCENNSHCGANEHCEECQCIEGAPIEGSCVVFDETDYQCRQACEFATNTCPDPATYTCNGYAGLDENNHAELAGGACIFLPTTQAEQDEWFATLTDCENNDDCEDTEVCMGFSSGISKCLLKCTMTGDTCPSTTLPGYEQYGPAQWPCQEYKSGNGESFGYCDPWGDPPECTTPGESCDPVYGSSEPVCGNDIVEEGEECETDNDCDSGETCTDCTCVTNSVQCGNGVIETGEECESDNDCGDDESCIECSCISDDEVAMCLLFGEDSYECRQFCTPLADTCGEDFRCYGYPGVNENQQLEIGGGYCAFLASTQEEYDTYVEGLTDCTNGACPSGQVCLGTSPGKCYDSCEITSDVCRSSVYPGYEQLGEAAWPCTGYRTSDGGTVGLCVPWGGAPECSPQGALCDPESGESYDPVCGNSIVETGEECESADHCETGESCVNCACVTGSEECGNGVIESGEECEYDNDCDSGESCVNCACVSGGAVCGNNVIETGEDCETDNDCDSDESCIDCICTIVDEELAMCLMFGEDDLQCRQFCTPLANTCGEDYRCNGYAAFNANQQLILGGGFCTFLAETQTEYDTWYNGLDDCTDGACPTGQVCLGSSPGKCYDTCGITSDVCLSSAYPGYEQYGEAPWPCVGYNTTDGGTIGLCETWGGGAECSTQGALCDPLSGDTYDPVCGNSIIEAGEDCETEDQCETGESCVNCVCTGSGAECGNSVIEAGEDCETDNDCDSGESCIDCICTIANDELAMCLSAGEDTNQCLQFCTPATNTCGDNYRCYGYASVNPSSELYLGGGYCSFLAETQTEYNTWYNGLDDCTDYACPTGQICLGSTPGKCLDTCEITSDICLSGYYPGYEDYNEFAYPCVGYETSDGGTVGLCMPWGDAPECTTQGALCDPESGDTYDPVCGNSIVEAGEDCEMTDHCDTGETCVDCICVQPL